MKKIFIYLFIFLFFALFLVGLDFAQTPEPNFSDREYDQTWSCLTIEQNGLPEFSGRKIPKSPIKLTGQCNDPVSCEVVICAIPSSGQEKGNKCHDRDLQSDQSEIPPYCYDKCWKNKDENISPELKTFFWNAISGQAGKTIPEGSVLGYMPYLSFDSDPNLNSFSSGSFTDIPAVLHNAHGHAIYLIYAAPKNGPAPTIVPLSPLPTQKNENNSTQKLGQITFSQTTIQVNEGNPQQCTIILWDPYGRVFDAKSLEPLGEDEAVVTLLDKDGNRVNLPTNDDSLDIFGLYNILVVKDDSYKLKVTPKTSHTFEPVDVNPLYKDLYEFIYKLGDPAFYEKASDPKRVDVALKPIGAPYSRPIEIGRMSQKDINTGTQFIIKVTHPLSQVKVFSNGKQLTDNGYGQPISDKTDKSGIWQAVIKKSLLSQYGYSIEVSKNPKYYSQDSFTKAATPDPNHITIDDSPKAGSDGVVMAEFNPLLEYIEGYVYDKDKKIMPKAKVSVILKMDKTIYYQTTADDTGFFTIYSKDLPFLDYYLEFVDSKTQTKTTQSTSQFVKNNDVYIKSEGLDLMSSTKNNQPIINPTTGQLNNDFRKVNAPLENNQNSSSPIKNTASLKIFMTIFILVVLIVASLGTVFYIRRPH